MEIKEPMKIEESILVRFESILKTEKGWKALANINDHRGKTGCQVVAEGILLSKEKDLVYVTNDSDARILAEEMGLEVMHPTEFIEKVEKEK